MAQYIDKNTLVAEIIKLDGLNCLESPTISHNEDYKCGYGRALEKVRNFIDTLEVKEVDLEEELSEVWKDWANEYDISFVSYKKIAKHFFEVGLKTQKGE